MISFIVVGFILFLIVKAYNALRRTPEDEGGDTELSVLREIREELRNRPLSRSRRRGRAGQASRTS